MQEAMEPWKADRDYRIKHSLTSVIYLCCLWWLENWLVGKAILEHKKGETESPSMDSATGLKWCFEGKNHRSSESHWVVRPPFLNKLNHKGLQCLGFISLNSVQSPPRMLDQLFFQCHVVDSESASSTSSSMFTLKTNFLTLKTSKI